MSLTAKCLGTYFEIEALGDDNLTEPHTQLSVSGWSPPFNIVSNSNERSWKR
jgi:hypothetical protein